MPTPQGFDVSAARQSGYSDDDILQHLSESRPYDVQGAVKSGYSKPEIIDHMASMPAGNAPKAAPAPAFGGLMGEDISAPTPQSVWMPNSHSAPAQTGTISAAEPGFGKRLQQTVANSAIGHAVQQTMPKVSDALGITPTETVYSPDYEQHKQQLISPDYLVPNSDHSGLASAERGVLKGAGSMTSAPALATVAGTAVTGGLVSPALPAIGKLMSAAFGAQASTDLIQQVPGIVQQWQAGDHEGVYEHLGRMGFDVAMLKGMVDHASSSPATAADLATQRGQMDYGSQQAENLGVPFVDQSPVLNQRAQQAEAENPTGIVPSTRKALDAAGTIAQQALQIPGKVATDIGNVAGNATDTAGRAMFGTGRYADRMDQPMPGSQFTRRDIYNAATENGVNLDLQQATGAPIPTTIKRVTENAILSSPVIENNNVRNVQAVNTWMDRLRQQMGFSPRQLNQEDVGNDTQHTLQQHQQTLTKQAQSGFDQLTQEVGASQPDASSIHEMAGQIVDANSEYYDKHPELMPKRAWAILQNLASGVPAPKPMSHGQASSGVDTSSWDGTAPKEAKPDTWSQLQQLRSDLWHESNSDPQIVGTRAEGWLKQMVGHIDDVMTGSASSLTREQSDIFRESNDNWRQMKEMYDSASSPFYRIVRAGSGTQAYSTLSNLAPQYLRQIGDISPEAKQQLRQAVLEEVLDPKGTKVQDPRNITRRLTDLEQMGSLFSPDELRQIALLGRVSDSVGTDLNRSGSGKNVIAWGSVAAPASMIGAGIAAFNPLVVAAGVAQPLMQRIAANRSINPNVVERAIRARTNSGGYTVSPDDTTTPSGGNPPLLPEPSGGTQSNLPPFLRSKAAAAGASTDAAPETQSPVPEAPQRTFQQIIRPNAPTAEPSAAEQRFAEEPPQAALPVEAKPKLPAFLSHPHPDVPGGQVVGTDAETGIPIVKQRTAYDAITGRKPQAVAQEPAAPELEQSVAPQEMRTKDITLDPQYQFKPGADSKTGLANPLDGSYDADRAGKIVVWKNPEDGLTRVVHGFHRLDLANRSEAESVKVEHLPESEVPDLLGRLKAAQIQKEIDASKVNTPALTVDTGRKDVAPEDPNLPGRAAEGVRMVDPRTLRLNPTEMQWRTLARHSIDPTEPFDQAKAGPVDIWHNPDAGQWQVVEGHHRVTHALATNTPEIETRVHDFESLKAARQWGALRNIENGNAEPRDAAMYFRESGTTPEALKSSGVNLKADLVEKASALANLAPSIWDKYRSGELDEAKSIAIGQHLSDPSQQAALAKLATKSNLSASEIEQSARRIKDSGNTSQGTMGLFGNSESSVSNFVETAKLASKLEKQLQSDKVALNFIAKASPEKLEALARADNSINVSKSSTDAQLSAALAEGFRRLQNRSGPVQHLLDEAGARITKGEKRDAVYSEVYPQIRQAILSEIGG